MLMRRSNRSGLSPEQMIHMFREMKAVLARHHMRDGVTGSVIRGVGALANAEEAAGLHLGARAGSAGLHLGVRAGSAAVRRASPIITGAARARHIRSRLRGLRRSLRRSHKRICRLELIAGITRRETKARCHA
jgi:hypothetical protein